MSSTATSDDKLPAERAVSLDLDSGWGIGEETFGRLIDQMRHDGVRELVEFGSGVSSIRLALALPEARILSIESNPQFFVELNRLKQEHQLDRALRIDLRPLCWQRHAGSLFLSYDPGPFPRCVDAVLIDGPPAWTRRGREACLYQVASHVRVGGRIYLDDYDRRKEKKIVRNWMLAYPASFRVSFIETGHGICVLEKIQSAEHPRTSVRSLADHVVELLRLLLSHPFRRI